MNENNSLWGCLSQVIFYQCPNVFGFLKKDNDNVLVARRGSCYLSLVIRELE